MKFEEYIRQEQPKKQSIGSVEVSDFWLTFHYPVIRIHSNLFYIVVSIGELSYILKSNSNVLWTMDNQGNPKSMSVFYHNAKPEIWSCKLKLCK
jgi:hypothetical protein